MKEEQVASARVGNSDREPATLTLEIALAFVADPQGHSLHRYKEITDDAALLLSTWPGPLSLDGIRRLSTKAASSLGKHRNALDLEGLRQLPLDVAQHLAGHRGELRLSGIGFISERVAEALSFHEGGLALDGLAQLSDVGIRHLADSAGELDLCGLYFLSARACKCLAERQEAVYLAHSSLTPAGARVLADADPDVVKWVGFGSPADAVCPPGQYLCAVFGPSGPERRPTGDCPDFSQMFRDAFGLGLAKRRAWCVSVEGIIDEYAGRDVCLVTVDHFEDELPEEDASEQADDD